MNRFGRAAVAAAVVTLVSGGVVSCSSGDGCGDQRYIIIASSAGSPGDEIAVNGSGFLDGCKTGAPLKGIELKMRDSKEYTLATVDADADGQVRFKFTVPKDARQGVYRTYFADQKGEFRVR